SNEGLEDERRKPATEHTECTEGARVAAGPRFARLDVTIPADTSAAATIPGARICGYHVPPAWPKARPRRLRRALRSSSMPSVLRFEIRWLRHRPERVDCFYRPGGGGAGRFDGTDTCSWTISQAAPRF